GRGPTADSRNPREPPKVCAYAVCCSSFRMASLGRVHFLSAWIIEEHPGSPCETTCDGRGWRLVCRGLRSCLPLAPQVANSQGLPISPDPAPSWLTKADDLVVDLPKSTTGGRKMLLAQTVLMNKNNVWGDASAGDRVTRPRWLRACLASNRVHTATHGHAHILRTRETLEIPQREQAKCAKKSDEA
ncbi:unnamed protein product, partial [Prorocentrum cordatum]